MTNLVPVSGNSNAVQGIAPAGFTNFDALEAFARSVSAPRLLPGDQHYFKKGRFYVGRGDSKVKIPDSAQFIFNVPNMVVGWRKWIDKKPVHAGIAYPALGQTWCAREKLDEIPPSDFKYRARDEIPEEEEAEVLAYLKANGCPNWDLSDEGELRDPWQQFAAVIIRQGTEINHYEASSWSGINALCGLAQDYAKGARLNTGKLPLVSLDSEEKKRGNMTYDAPVFKITGWVVPTAADAPNGAVSVTPALTNVSDVDDEIPHMEPKAAASEPEVLEAAPKARRRPPVN